MLESFTRLLTACCLVVLFVQPAEAGLLKGLYKVATAPVRATRAIIVYNARCAMLGAYCLRYYWE